MDEITKEFLIESHENLDRLDRDLVTLERDPHSKETIGSIFRTIHTLKGTSGFLGFSKLEAVAHVGENLLSKLRDGVFVINPDMTSALLSTVDAVRFMLGQVEATGQPGDKDYSSLIDLLTRLNDGKSIPPQAILTDTPAPVASEPVPALAVSSTPAPAAAPVSAPSGTKAPPPSQPPQHDLRFAAAESAETRNSAVSDSSIRVDVGLLDKLMNLVGELVLARNQVLQFTIQSADSTFLATSQRLNLITTELQGSVMKTRMQPIGNVWGKLPRVVRDLAAACGKEVRIEMEGKETELDKTIIEAIKDPLTHIVRNSVDHGMELPADRMARGKMPSAILPRAIRSAGSSMP